MQTSSRRGIQFPNLDRSDRPDVPAHIKNLVDALELDPSIGQGAAGSRPANPGYPRYFYWATDTHVLSYWDGSSWTAVGSTDLIPQTLIDAKGDIIVGLSDNVAGRVALGTNGYIVTADNTQPSGVKWAMNEVRDLIAAKGDILAGTGTDALSRVAVGADGTSLLADSAQTAGVRFGAPALSYQQVHLSADVTLSSLNVFYDGPSLSLAAGTWLMIGKVACNLTNTSDVGNAKLWDGATVIDSGQFKNNCPHISLQGVVAPTSTTVYKISAANVSSAGGTIFASIGQGNTASGLVAVRIG